jgi:predicted permease
MSTIIADVRYAVRSLRRRPVFALTAILTIGIGIGANASVFTVVSGFMLQPLPYEEPDELIAIWSARPSLGWSGTDVGHADAWDWRERAATLADVAVFDGDGFNLTGDGPPELVSGLRVTPNFFSLVGRHPSLGRGFEEGEIGEGQDRVVVLTDGFWERRFARDPDVVGSTLLLDGIPVVVVGIMPPDFLFHNGRPDVIRPWGFQMSDGRRGNHSANAIARLREAASVELARTELLDIAVQLEAEHAENEGWTVEVVPLMDDVLGEIAPRAAVVLMGAVGFILLMACVNVANLLLARGGGRSREIAVRAALGAGRPRVVRQLLTESLVLATVGAALGLASANWAYRGIVAALPSDMPPVFQFGMDGMVLGFTAVITVVATLLFGMFPAVRATRDPGGPLRGGRSGRVMRADSRFGGTLVVLQTAMAVVLLVGGGLLMKSITGMKVQDFGFEAENVLTARLSPPSAEYETAEEAAAYWRAVVERVRELPGVLEVGTTQSHPLMGSNWSRTVRIAGQPAGEEDGRPVRLTYASEGLFEALRFGMVQGRTFRDGDGPDAAHVAIVNEAFVRRYLGPDEEPLEQTLLADVEWEATIVGVVHDVIERGVDRPPEPALYVPIAQADVRTRSLVMRTAGEPTEVVRSVQDAVWSVDADIPVYEVQTMEALVDDRVGGFAVIGYLMGTFAVLSLLLGAIGIYGVTAFAAGQRTSEIGVRLALGARRGDVVAMVVREGAIRTGLGLGLGLVLALAGASGLSGILVGVSPRDPFTFIGVTLVLGLVSYLGLYIPARRASRVDPVQALAAE